VCLLATCVISTGSAQTPKIEAKPKQQAVNILFVVADDLGMYDIGAYGSEINTPTIDSIASTGVMFTQFYTSATCSPTRSMLLSGADNHTAGLGNMAEHMAPNQRDRKGYQGFLSPDVISLPEILQQNGYNTYMAGKWHLGKKLSQLPANRGFDESFVLLQGGASYFDDMMGLTSAVPNALYRHNEKEVTELPPNFYSSEFYANFIIENIEKNKNNNKPFFAYLAFTAPHWPLQVKDEHLDLYKGQYNDGYDALQVRRIQSAINKKLLSKEIIAAQRPSHLLPWVALNEKQQKVESRAMEIYSSLVERMDHQFGRVLTYLAQTEQLENTLIVFLSDNGADGSNRALLPGNDTWLPQAWDLSYENMGKVGSYVYPGPGWARASVGPASMYKEFLSEGGINSPAIIHYPKAITIPRITRELTSVMDIMPTVLDFIGIDKNAPETSDFSSGISLKDFLIDPQKNGLDRERILAWGLFGQKAVRKGHWKLSYLSSSPKWLKTPNNADQWALFDLSKDPGETTNLVEEKREKFKELLAIWQIYEQQHQIVQPVGKKYKSNRLLSTVNLSNAKQQ
jgi:arylsulfatase